jgi:hypothetical protein
MRALALLAVALLCTRGPPPAADAKEPTLMEPEAEDINGETVGLVLSEWPCDLGVANAWSTNGNCSFTDDGTYVTEVPIGENGAVA